MAARPGEVRRWIAEYPHRNYGSDCVIWPFGTNGDGYATAQNPRTGRSEGAYRVTWEVVHGVPFPSDGEARHTCGNGHLACVNHAHVTFGSHLENVADRRAHGTENIGSRNGRAVLTEEDVRAICRELAAGALIARLAENYKVSGTTISSIWHGKLWTHVDVPRSPQAVQS